VSAAREAMLARVRAALDGAGGEAEVPRGYRTEAAGDVVARFAERAAEYRAQVVRTGQDGLGEVLAGLVSGIVAVPADLPEGWRPAGVELAVGATGIDQLDSADAVVTGCALAIAETGTLVLDGGPGQGIRAMTLIPDHHVCIVRAEQIVATVPEAVRRLGTAVRERRAPITFVSGPSATSDIELSRVEGVHGPRRLDIVVV
jgi:L-lactate dehydrogenase complex protein LldG